MKTIFTFAELSKIFAQVEKVEKYAIAFAEIAEQYTEIDHHFDEEFAKYNYSFYGVPQEIHDLFDAKCALMDERGKAEKKAYKAIKDFGGMIEIGTNYPDIVEDRVSKFISGKYYWDAAAMIERVKHLALAASRRIKINQ